jgi:hypothetical protein
MIENGCSDVMGSNSEQQMLMIIISQKMIIIIVTAVETSNPTTNVNFVHADFQFLISQISVTNTYEEMNIHRNELSCSSKLC